jgi:hypothetical protein
MKKGEASGFAFFILCARQGCQVLPVAENPASTNMGFNFPRNFPLPPVG